MKAVVFHEHGGVDKLRYEDVEDAPKPGAHGVKVRVGGCGVNHLDIWVREGLRGPEIPMPHILGSEVTGEVVEAGRSALGFKVGQRVMVMPGISCRRCSHCLSGNDSQCGDFRIMGYQTQGGYAEFVTVSALNVLPISDAWSLEEWAAVPLVFLTAWHMLLTRGALRPGEDVLIHAAGSGIGSAAVQIAKLCGARVITTVGSAEKIGKAKDLGADQVINYREQDFSEAVNELTADKGVELVFEHIGQETWEKSLRCLARGGRMVVCGATSGQTATVDIPFLFLRQLSIHGSYMGGRRELLDVLRLLDQGKLRPVVDTVFPLKDAVLAHERMQGRKSFGKLVLRP
ncbi:MAG: zinc-binding dehydrogenase [Candidatus Brocadiales bacterium]